MRGISEESLKEISANSNPDVRLVVNVLLQRECKELNLWIPIDEFLKSGFVGKCWIFTEGIVLETEFDLNGFWYAFKYIENNKITHVMPIHKPEPPR